MNIKSTMKKVVGIVMTVAILGTSFYTNTEQPIAATKSTYLKNEVLKPGKEVSVQLDGKGKKEKISYSVSTKSKKKSDTVYYTTTLSLKINGKEVLKKTVKDYAYRTNAKITGKVMLMDINKNDGKKDIMLTIAAVDENWCTPYCLIYHCQYSNNKLSVQEDIGAKLETLHHKGYGDGCNDKCYHQVYGFAKDFKTKGDGKLEMPICIMDSKSIGISGFHGTINFSLVKGSLKINKNNFGGNITKELNGDEMVMKINQDVKAYTTPGGKQLAINAKKRSNLTLIAYKSIKGKLYIKVKDKNGKMGWYKDSDYKKFSVDWVTHM